MPVPSVMSDLALAAASNYPTGGETIGSNLDNYLRAHASILRSIYSVSTSEITSASTIDLAAADGEKVSINGTTTINSLGTGYAGCYREAQFNGVLTITHSASLLLPNAANITTAVNDVYAFRCITPGNWIMVNGSRAAANFANVNLTGTSTYNSVEIGFRGVPRTVQNSGYTFVADDKGRCRAKTDTGAYTYTVNNGVHADGDVITVQNLGSSGNITIAQGAGVTLQLGGSTSTGNRTLAPGGLATIYFDSASHATVAGAGLS